MLLSRCKSSLLPLLATIFAVGCGAALPEKDSSQSDLRFGSRVHKLPKRDSSSITPNSAPAGARLTYFGGRVVSNLQVVQVIWGSGSYESHVTSTATPSMATFYQQSLNSAYVDWLDGDYNTVNPSPAGNTTKTNQHIGRGSFLRQVTITPSVTGSVSDAQIQSEIAAQIQAGHLPAPTHDAAGNNNTYYAVFFPHGTTITQGGSSSCVGGGFCAYHGTIANVPSNGEVYYGVHPDMQAGSGCDTGCGTGTPFGNYTSVASHEMIETITDCEVGLATVNAPPLAWYDNTNGEIGDICNAQQGSIVGGDGQTYTVQQEFSNSANNCITTGTVTTTNDFSISAANSSLTISSGSSGTDAISTAITSGNAESISLSATGQPSGVTVSFSPSSVSSGGSSTMTVNVASTASAGTSTITVHGAAASGSHTTTVSLTVTSTATNNFSMSASPSSVSFAAGGSASSTISTAVVSGSPQPVSLSASGQPAGVTVSFNPTSVNVGSSSTATISSTSSAAPGSYTITVTGTDASATHSTSIALTITGGGGGGGSIVNGGFETGTLSGWTQAGASESVVNSGCHGGTFCARLGSTSPTNGDSTISQTFTAPSGGTSLSVWYKETCPDTITYDWALATLTDNTAGTSATVITKACATNSWTQATSAVTAGHSYTLTLTSHDDNYSSDPTYTLFDDVSIATGTPPPPGGITNGGFESGLTGWTRSGTTSTTSNSHSGTTAAVAGNTVPTNGDSSLAQTFTAPSGTSRLSLYYANNCPDTVTYDWVTVTLRDNTSGTTTTVVPKTCATSYVWTNVTSAVTAGHSYTLTLTSHDDNYSADPTYTLFDDVVLQ